jgi:hypothetical protein
LNKNRSLTVAAPMGSLAFAMGLFSFAMGLSVFAMGSFEFAKIVLDREAIGAATVTERFLPLSSHF